VSFWGACVLLLYTARHSALESPRASSSSVLSTNVFGGGTFGGTAYDYFPCQHQIFYHLKGGKSFWYELPIGKQRKLIRPLRRTAEAKQLRRVASKEHETAVS
jgi:hypothetical protein